MSLWEYLEPELSPYSRYLWWALELKMRHVYGGMQECSVEWDEKKF